MKRSWQPSGILHILAIVIVSHSAFTQTPPIQFQHLAGEQGLSHNRAWSFTQDKYGFIWIGTGNGLDRFDGYKVDVYRREPGNKNSLPGNFVRSLFTDSHGTVWIGTQTGLAFYDYHSNSFESFFQDTTDNSLPGNSISVIKEDGYGNLWIGTNTGLCSFDIKKKRFQRFLHDPHSNNSISNDHIRDIDFAPDGTMWITTGKGLNRLDLSTMRFVSFINDPKDTTTLSGNVLTQIAMDKDGNIWTSVNETVFLECFNTRTYRVKHFKYFTEKESRVPSNTPRDIFIDGSGRLWIGTDREGLHLFLPGKNTFYQYKADILDPSKMQSNTVVAIFQDKSNLIWLGTNAGAERFNPDQSKFMIFRPRSPAYLAATNAVTAIAEDSSRHLWLGTFSGIFIMDRKTGAYTNYQFDPKDPRSLSDQVVQSVCRDKWGNMWVGTMDGLNLFDPIHKRFRRFYTKKNEVRGIAFIVTIFSCKNGDLFFGGQGGLSKFDFENDSVHHLSNEGVTVIFEDNRERLWIGTGGGIGGGGTGLLKWNRSTGEKTRFSNNLDDTSSLASNNIYSVAQDRDGVIWISTGAGLCRFNETTRKFTTFSEKNGLPNTQVGQLLVDDKNRIWMSTNVGISMLNESRSKFTHYDPADGLQGREFIGQTVVKTHDGYLCYGGRNGFNIFHPDSLRINNFIPPVVLRRIKIFDEELEMDSSFMDLKKLKLSYKKNFFSLEFAALNYDHPEKNQYDYQLINFDKKVVRNGTNRGFSYTNVPPGNYTLKVTASNNDDVWNTAGFELELIVIPPFWATSWFKTIVVLVLIGSVLLFFRLRENRIRKEQARQTAINKQIAEIRMTALRGQMNPHFIFNSLNSIQHFITTREKEEALNYLSKFSKLIRKILENSRENTVSISNELQLLELYIQLEQLRFSNKFDYHISIDEKIDKENTEIPPLLIQPYIENAIIHGLINKNDKGNLWLSLERNNGLLVCKIEDNGIGRAKAQEIEQGKVSRHKSLGITVTEERISGLFELLDYKMEVITEDLFEIKQHSGEIPQPAGTRVTISIPVKEEE